MEMESRQQRGLTGTTEEEEGYFLLDSEHQSQFIMAKSQYGTWKDATHQSNPLHDHESARVILQNEKRAAWERERRGSGYMREQRSPLRPRPRLSIYGKSRFPRLELLNEGRMWKPILHT